ncbi:MAG: putative porin [Nitrospinae bacterium]|nr:putative porin [Nitrospinota bacterium]
MSKIFIGLIFTFFSTVVLAVPAFADKGDYERRLKALEERQKANSALLEVLKRLTWGGDFRLRYQHDAQDLEGTNTLDRNRFRLRFRLNGKVHMYKDLDIGFRMVTGATGIQTATNTTFDEGFGSKSFDLDRAYFKWNPKPFKLQGGKFQTPFMKSELIWQNDVNVEGVSEEFSHKMGDTRLELILGQFVIDEIHPGDDIYLLAYQGILQQQTKIGKFKIAIAYYDYVNHEDPATAPTAFGNATVNPTTSEVKLVNLMSDWSEKIFGYTLKIFGEYAQNIGALAAGNADLDTAWQTGFQYGKSGQRFGDFDMRLIYRVVQTEAVLDVLADAIFNGGSNNAKGIEAGGSFGLRKGVRVSFTYFNTVEERGARNERQSFQADLSFNF